LDSAPRFIAEFRLPITPACKGSETARHYPDRLRRIVAISAWRADTAAGWALFPAAAPKRKVPSQNRDQAGSRYARGRTRLTAISDTNLKSGPKPDTFPF
jgi:hypothetical protein